MQLLRLAIDFDDVIAGFNQAFIPYMNNILGTSVTYETHRSFYFPDVYGISLEQSLEHLSDFSGKKAYEISHLPATGCSSVG